MRESERQTRQHAAFDRSGFLSPQTLPDSTNDLLADHFPETPADSSRRALVLNSSYQPVKLVSWQKALCLWFQGKAEIVEYHTFTVRSASATFRLPSVLRLKRYVSPRRSTRLRFSRENIYLRDGFVCQYCAKKFAAKELTLDHVVPASKLGRKDWTNVVTACRPCNHRKANRTPLGANMPLLNEPRIPTWLPAVQPQLRVDRMPDEWKVYMATITLAIRG